jgi:hypothetical protein
MRNVVEFPRRGSTRKVTELPLSLEEADRVVIATLSGLKSRPRAGVHQRDHAAVCLAAADRCHAGQRAIRDTYARGHARGSRLYGAAPYRL